MLNKLLFNNLIISNKKKLKQARVQTINKFVHKLRKLQQLQEKKPDDSKIKDKIRRSTECIEFLKKLKPHDMVKRTLILEKGPLAVISNDRATPEEISFATLALNKVMQILLKDFKEKLELKDNLEWKEAILAKSKRREKIEKTEEKKRKRKELKDQKLIERKRKEWLEQNKLNNDETNFSKEKGNENSQDVSRMEGEWLVEELSIPVVNSNKTEEIVSNQKEYPKSEQISENKSLNIKNPNNKKKENKIESLLSENKEASLIKNETKPQSKLKNSKKAEENSLGNSSTSSKREDNVNESEEISHKNVRIPPKENKNIKITKVVDPFFFTDTGENYLATAIIYPEEPSAAEDTSFSKTFNNRKESRTYKDSNNFEKLHQSHKSFNKDGLNPISNEIDDTLHPSWKAKLKQKPIIINNMINKKIKFDDDGRSEVLSKSLPPIMKSEEETNTLDNKDLHPSWAAKQKIKPIIKEFQGKKITFDDD